MTTPNENSRKYIVNYLSNDLLRELIAKIEGATSISEYAVDNITLHRGDE